MFENDYWLPYRNQIMFEICEKASEKHLVAENPK